MFDELHTPLLGPGVEVEEEGKGKKSYVKRDVGERRKGEKNDPEDHPLMDPGNIVGSPRRRRNSHHYRSHSNDEAQLYGGDEEGEEKDSRMRGGGEGARRGQLRKGVSRDVEGGRSPRHRLRGYSSHEEKGDVDSDSRSSNGMGAGLMDVLGRGLEGLGLKTATPSRVNSRNGSPSFSTSSNTNVPSSPRAARRGTSSYTTPPWLWTLGGGSSEEGRMSVVERVRNNGADDQREIAEGEDGGWCGPKDAVPREKKQALWTDSNVPLIARLLLPIFILLSSAMFLYGQITTMWDVRARFVTDFDIDLRPSYNYGPNGTKGPAPWEQLYQSSSDSHVTIFTLTFMDSLSRLWNSEANQPATSISAALLFLFSGCWPHVKLFLLLVLWCVPMKRELRKNTLWWVDSLGKYSLADIIVVVLLLAVFDVDVTLSPDSGVWWASALAHDPVLTEVIRINSGFVRVRLFVTGENGIYVFCGAVFLSLLCSATIEFFEEASAAARVDHERSIAHLVEQLRMESGKEQTNDGAEGGAYLKPPMVGSSSKHRGSNSDRRLAPFSVSMRGAHYHHHRTNSRPFTHNYEQDPSESERGIHGEHPTTIDRNRFRRRRRNSEQRAFRSNQAAWGMDAHAMFCSGGYDFPRIVRPFWIPARLWESDLTTTEPGVQSHHNPASTFSQSTSHIKTVARGGEGTQGNGRGEGEGEEGPNDGAIEYEGRSSGSSKLRRGTATSTSLAIPATSDTFITSRAVKSLSLLPPIILLILSYALLLVGLFAPLYEKRVGGFIGMAVAGQFPLARVNKTYSTLDTVYAIGSAEDSPKGDAFLAFTVFFFVVCTPLLRVPLFATLWTWGKGGVSFRSCRSTKAPSYEVNTSSKKEGASSCFSQCFANVTTLKVQRVLLGASAVIATLDSVPVFLIAFVLVMLEIAGISTEVDIPHCDDAKRLFAEFALSCGNLLANTTGTATSYDSKLCGFMAAFAPELALDDSPNEICAVGSDVCVPYDNASLKAIVTPPPYVDFQAAAKFIQEQPCLMIDLTPHNAIYALLVSMLVSSITSIIIASHSSAVLLGPDERAEPDCRTSCCCCCAPCCCGGKLRREEDDAHLSLDHYMYQTAVENGMTEQGGAKHGMLLDGPRNLDRGEDENIAQGGETGEGNGEVLTMEAEGPKEYSGRQSTESGIKL